ncbi:protein-glutamate methylesterase/protein-glutamine glutaminase [Alkalicoccobacillus porphyridii]|uniref:Protein-glutamate methylesterase/protein-glutamine glutaminase n=1 Tax=Alkalicoccobacillus porphyridii TaxID=2597270 RepID=A0A553ZYA3_9BACI|nr:chemotaxis response regulator protein-glutamate methylesterase [Alkalicoccobacillus porphyridii]TSB46428.1 chemotaxis response regulator protein-glutamate methylesterase [Alkalicoccobacillus porphyridii]
MKQIRVLIVDDSAFMRKVMTDILQKDPSIEVIGIARNGMDAVKKNQLLQPDVITLDVEMPLLDGLGALKIIMEERPCPVVMVSSLTKAGAHTTMLAMEQGAVDFVAKTNGPISLDLETIAEELREKVKLAAGATVMLPAEPAKKVSLPTFIKSVEMPLSRKLVAIGVSTGGPKALKEVLQELPANFPSPIVIVQHMPKGFTKSLADRLDTLSAISVKEAEDNEVIKKGTAYIAPGGKHLNVVDQNGEWVCKLGEEDPVNGHRPSVNVLLESIATLHSVSLLAVIMTGMGSDGSKGLERLKEKKVSFKAIAQSEESCVVFGMPKMAIRTNYVNEVVHLKDIASRILSSY